MTVTVLTSKSTRRSSRIVAATGNVLIVGHSNTIPDVVKELGVTPPVTIGDDEFDNLFIVSTGTSPSVLRLHYR